MNISIKMAIIALGLALTTIPAMASGTRTGSTGPHLRTATVHDRSPRVHSHESVAHH